MNTWLYEWHLNYLRRIFYSDKHISHINELKFVECLFPKSLCYFPALRGVH